MKFRPKKIITSPPKPKAPSYRPSISTIGTSLGGVAAASVFLSNPAIQEAISTITENPLIAGGAVLILLILLK